MKSSVIITTRQLMKQPFSLQTQSQILSVQGEKLATEEAFPFFCKVKLGNMLLLHLKKTPLLSIVKYKCSPELYYISHPKTQYNYMMANSLRLMQSAKVVFFFLSFYYEVRCVRILCFQ